MTDPRTTSHPTGARHPQAGFTVAELVVTLAIFVGIMIAMLALFDASNRVTRVQTYVADLQQNTRVAQDDLVRMIRMAGRGGLPKGTMPAGSAISVIDDVDPSTRIGDATSPLIVPGTDVLTIRGVISGSVYQVQPESADFDPVNLKITLRNPSPSGVPQSLYPLKQLVDEGVKEALLLRSPVGQFSVVELDPDAVDTDVSDPDNFVTLGFRASGGERADTYATISSTTLASLGSVAAFGVLEEHRYYVRDLENGESGGRLARARFFPGTDDAYSTGAGSPDYLTQDVAENILDLQLAVGLDRDRDGDIDEADPPSGTDDWLFNAADDDPTDSEWNANPLAAPPLDEDPTLHFLRVTTLARTDRPDLNYVSQPLTAIEDHAYNEPATPATQAEREARMYRRRLLQTTVDMRNIQ